MHPKVSSRENPNSGEAGRGSCGPAGRHDQGTSSPSNRESASAREAAHMQPAGSSALPTEAMTQLHAENCPVCGEAPDGAGPAWHDRMRELLEKVPSQTPQLSAPSKPSRICSPSSGSSKAGRGDEAARHMLGGGVGGAAA